MSGPAPNVCYVLREDPELAEAIAPNMRSEAFDTIVAREVELPAGPWRDRRVELADGLGLLVLDGLMFRRVGIDRRFGAELIGEGDLLRAPDPRATRRWS